MKAFYGEDVLLRGETARPLYAQVRSLPILDYHCHLSPQEIWEDRHFANLTQLWLAGDHYKWRAMRQNGVPESQITGAASDWEKFQAYAATLPWAVGNPLYAWSHMELAALFAIHTPLNPESAQSVWEQANAQLAGGGFSARELLRRFSVETVCTTDDPADSLEYHEKLRADTDMPTQVLPTFRPERLFDLRPASLGAYLPRLENAARREIRTLEDLLEVLRARMDFFAARGCRAADHGMTALPALPGTFDEAKRAFEAARDGRQPTPESSERYADFLLRFFAGEYRQRGWGMQLHLAPLRNVNSTLFARLGPDIGTDTIGDPVPAARLARVLDAVEREGGLPRTVLYSLHPSDVMMLAAMTGSFSGEMPGKIQLGAAWWFNDHYDGIRTQLRGCAAAGLLGRFIGMLTDSRSFTSYVRFDYFRRIVCSEIAQWVDAGEYDSAGAPALLRAICYDNAKAFFRLAEKGENQG